MRRHALAVAAILAAIGCGQRPKAIALLSTPERLRDASVAGHGLGFVRGQLGKSVRLGDVEMRTLPAGPPSRVEYDVEIPKGAHLSFAAGVGEALQGRGAVEFSVKLLRDGREQVLHRSLMDPTNRPEQRGFVRSDVDLSPHAGAKGRLVFETSGHESAGDARAAVWGNPVLTSPATPARLAIVYLVDTLRADHTTVYGYTRDTTPRLRALARDAVVFDAAVANSSWTKPSVASLFTSQLPAVHGTVFVRGRLDPRQQTLAEELRERGFATAAVIANAALHAPKTGFEQGFDVFAASRPVAADSVDAALRLLDATRGLDTLLYVHTMDPHIPYSPPPPFDAMFDPKPSPEIPGRDPRKEPKAAANLAAFVARYDGEVAYGDREFGRFVSELKARGLYDGALLVFLADHGEEFLDHGGFGHASTLFDELVRIPLLVKFPGNREAGRRVAVQVQELDIFPSVLQELGLALPLGLVGQPLQPVLTGRPAAREALLELSHRGIVAVGSRSEREKYVRRFSPQADELYFDLRADPGERDNAAARAGERLRQLRSGIGPALVPSPYRASVRFVGPGRPEVEISAAGWIESVETSGFGPKDVASLSEAKDSLRVVCDVAAGSFKEVSFLTRPRGTQVTVTGRISGRPLRAGEVFLGGDAQPAEALPAMLPDLDSGSVFKSFAPETTRRAGVYAWITPLPGREALEMSAEAQEQLRALGYLQ